MKKKINKDIWYIENEDEKEGVNEKKKSKKKTNKQIILLIDIHRKWKDRSHLKREKKRMKE